MGPNLTFNWGWLKMESSIGQQVCWTLVVGKALRTFRHSVLSSITEKVDDKRDSLYSDNLIILTTNVHDLFRLPCLTRFFWPPSHWGSWVNCFLIWYYACFERKGLWNFFTGNAWNHGLHVTVMQYNELGHLPDLGRLPKVQVIQQAYGGRFKLFSPLAVMQEAKQTPSLLEKLC